ncbi:MAG TPA: serine protease [Thioploca sp.]|nr:serine protease [Thioploca sp.]
MTKLFEPYLTRLWTTDKGGVVGAGFLVTKKHVLTCAHVVNDVFGVPEDSAEQPTGKIVLDFPFLAPNHSLQAHVIIWYPPIPNNPISDIANNPISDIANNPISDIAVLELLTELPLPRGCQPVSLLKNNALRGHSFQAYGFPAGYNEGLFVEGEIKDMRSDGTVQVQGRQPGTGYGITHGFSGGPVWDEHETGIVGMVVAADNRLDNSIAFFIHTDSLVKAWPKLDPDRTPKPKRKYKRTLLPYLPNRRDQELELGELIRAHDDKHRPLLCVVHGDEYQCSDKFLDRIREESLPNIIPEQMHFGVDLHPFVCDTFQSVNELHRKMLANLGELFINNMYATCDEVAQAIAQRQCPVILHTDMSTTDWQRGGHINIIHGFIQFWADWPVLSAQNHLLLVCLCFNYRDIEKMSWLKRLFKRPSVNQAIRNTFKDLASEHCRVLPELPSIERTHVEQWAKIYLSEFYYELIPYIRELFQPPIEKIAMEPLAQQLKQILKECCDMKTTF